MTLRLGKKVGCVGISQILSSFNAASAFVTMVTLPLFLKSCSQAPFTEEHLEVFNEVAFFSSRRLYLPFVPLPLVACLSNFLDLTYLSWLLLLEEFFFLTT